MGNAQVEDLALTRGTFAIEDVELGALERRRDLVLDDLDASLVADDLVALLDGTGAADVQTHGGIELERVAAGSGLGIAEHDADLHPDLVDENDQRVGALDGAGELAQRLAHQPGLQAGQRIAHVALDLGARRERGHRVDHDQIDRAGTDQRIADFQGLLTGVGLGDEQFGQAHAQLGGVLHVECVFGIDEGAGATQLLHLGNDLQCEGGLAGRLRPVDLDDAAARQAANAQRDVQPQRTGGDHFDVRGNFAVGHAHDRTLAELLFDLCQSGSQCLGLLCACLVVHDGCPVRRLKQPRL